MVRLRAGAASPRDVLGGCHPARDGASHPARSTPIAPPGRGGGPHDMTPVPFETADGVTLGGAVHEPDGPPRAALVVAGGTGIPARPQVGVRFRAPSALGLDGPECALGERDHASDTVSMDGY